MTYWDVTYWVVTYWAVTYWAVTFWADWHDRDGPVDAVIPRRTVVEGEEHESG